MADKPDYSDTTLTLAEQGDKSAYEPLEIPNDAALILGTVVLRWCPHEAHQ